MKCASKRRSNKAASKAKTRIGFATLHAIANAMSLPLLHLKMHFFRAVQALCRRLLLCLCNALSMLLLQRMLLSSHTTIQNEIAPNQLPPNCSSAKAKAVVVGRHFKPTNNRPLNITCPRTATYILTLYIWMHAVRNSVLVLVA